MAVSLATLTTRRTALVAEMRAAQADAETGPGEGVMTPEQQAAFDAMKVALTNLENAIANRAAVDDLDRQTRGLQIGGGSADQFEVAARGFNIARALAGAAGLHVDDGPEREISRELQKRSGKSIEGFLIPFQALSTRVEQRVLAPTGGGAGLVGTYLDASQYIDALRAALVCAKAGCRYLTGLDTLIDIPALSVVAQATWVADGSAIPTDAAETFGKISLRPRLLGGLVEFTRAQLITSTPAVQDAVRNDLVQVLARGIDAAVISGSGGLDPRGVLNQVGIGSVAISANGGPLTWAAVLALVESVQVANAPEDHQAFVGNPKVRAQLMNTLKFPGVSGSMAVMDKADDLGGYPYFSTTLCPANGTKGTGSNLSTLIFGSWPEVLVGIWGAGVEILVNPWGSPQFAAGSVQVRALINADVALRHSASFAAISDIAAP